MKCPECSHDMSERTTKGVQITEFPNCGKGWATWQLNCKLDEDTFTNSLLSLSRALAAIKDE